MKRKLVIWGLVLTMTAGMFGGCGNGAKQSGTPGQSAPEIQKQKAELSEGREQETQSQGQETQGQENSGQNSGEQGAKNLSTGEEISVLCGYPQNEPVSSRFAKELLSASLEERNPVLSPVSAYLALELAGCGAEGDTAKEFESVLGREAAKEAQRIMEVFSQGMEEEKGLPPESAINVMHSKVVPQWQSLEPLEPLGYGEKGIQVCLANSAWIDTHLLPRQEWVTLVSNQLQAQVKQMKLSTGEAQSSINQWVDENTKGLIPNLLTQPLSEDTRLALFNTVYFKGKWQSPFEKTSTHERGFCLENKSDSATCREMVLTQMMRKYDEKISYIGAETYAKVGAEMCEGVVLPYRDSSMVFVALKPAGGQTVRELYENLSMGEIISLVENAQTESLDLMLPKFRVTYDRELNSDLKKMGLRTAFEEDLADFSGIGTTDCGSGIFIDLVRQKVVFILDEEGTEAAAVTMVTMADNAAMIRKEPRQVYFDEPFFYLILDTQEQMPLFMGIMDDPTKE